MAGKSRVGRFRAGSGGVCEASLYEFASSDGPEPRVIRVAARDITEALAYIMEAYADFRVVRIEFVGMVRLVSGTPVD